VQRQQISISRDNHGGSPIQSDFKEFLRQFGRIAEFVPLIHLVRECRWTIWKPAAIFFTLVSCYTNFVETKIQLRNVTVTLEEDVAQWARIEAARRDTSVSRLLGELLKERMTAQDGYERAKRRALARKPFLRSDGRYLTREEAHDRGSSR
jgi:hypothetical protein